MIEDERLRMEDRDARSSILNPRPCERVRPASEVFLSSLDNGFMRNLLENS